MIVFFAVDTAVHAHGWATLIAMCSERMKKIHHSADMTVLGLAADVVAGRWLGTAVVHVTGGLMSIVLVVMSSVPLLVLQSVMSEQQGSKHQWPRVSPCGGIGIVVLLHSQPCPC
jgi:hypothetical protein